MVPGVRVRLGIACACAETCACTRCSPAHLATVFCVRVSRAHRSSRTRTLQTPNTAAAL